MTNVWQVRLCAEAGLTKVQTAAHLGITRQKVWQIAKNYDITFHPTRKEQHRHGEGRKPSYRAGCADCQELMRAWYHKSKSKKESNDDPEALRDY